jgi:hypothetical protein
MVRTVKKLAMALVAVGTVLLATSVTNADYPPGVGIAALERTPAVGAPGIAVQARVVNCFPGESIPFALGASNSVAVCTGAAETPWVNLTAPPAVGMYQVTAQLGAINGVDVQSNGIGGVLTGFMFPQQAPPERPRTLSLSFEVIADTTTTAAPTTAAPTTVAPTTTIDGGQVPPLPPTDVPTTVDPSLTIPATGSGSLGSTTSIAVGFLVVGFGMFVVAQARRRSSSSS